MRNNILIWFLTSLLFVCVGFLRTAEAQIKSLVKAQVRAESIYTTESKANQEHMERQQLSYVVRIVKPEHSLYVVGSKLNLLVQDAGLTQEESDATVVTVTPTGIADVKKIQTGKWEIAFKEKGTAMLKATVPAKAGVHDELTSSVNVSIIPMPALKFYANDEQVTGSSAKIRVNTTPSIRVVSDPIYAELNSFSWQCVPNVTITANENVCTFEDMLSEGTYTLTATSNEIPTLTGTITLEVADFTEVVIAEKNVTLYLNGQESEKSHQLYATVEPSDKVATQDVTFAIVTPADDCVDVSKTGLVTAKKAGKVRIKVTSDADSEATPAYCTVTVTYKLEEIEIHAADPHVISDNKIKLHKGEAVALFVTFEPDGVLDKGFSWQFDPSSGITIQELPNGDTQFVVNKTGAWEIIALPHSNPSKQEHITLEVDNPLKGFIIYQSGEQCTNLEVQLKKGDEKDFTYSPVPSDADVRTDIQWSSASPAKVSIDAITGHLKVEDAALVGDKVKITVKTVYEPIIETSFTVCVVDVVVEPESVSIVPREDQTIFVGDTLEFKATVTPSKAPQTVIWEVTPDNETLIIDTDGKAVAKKRGTVTVKAITGNEKTSNEVKVEIKPKTVQPPTKIEFVNPPKSVKENEEESFTIQFTPDKEVDKSLDITFSPAGYLSLKSVNGEKITVLGVKDSEDQEITITAKSKNNASLAPATCKVKVTKGTPAADARLATIVISPNPFTSVLRITNPSALSAQYELFNIQGMCLRQGYLESGETNLNTTDLVAGLYMLRITASDGNSKTWQVVK